MSAAFESFVQQELPKRGYLNTDVNPETVIVRRGVGPRQFGAVALLEGQILALVNGVLTGVYITDSGIGGNTIIRKAILNVTTPQVVWVITHNLNSENVIIQAFDQSKFVIIPNTIQIVDSNTVQLTFNTAQNGVARVIFLD